MKIRFYSSPRPGGGLEGEPLQLQRCANVAALRAAVEAELQTRLVAPDGWTIVDARSYAKDEELGALLSSDLALGASAPQRELLVVREGYTEDVFSHGEYRPAAAPSLIDAVNNDLDNVSALNEIIENSIEFLRPGAVNRIWINLDREKSTITIRDNGIGMTEAQVRCFVTAGRTKRSPAAAASSSSSAAAAAASVHVVPALKHLSGKIGVYGIGKYAALHFGKRAKVKMETRTEDSPLYTRMLMSNESNEEVGAAGAQEIETRPLEARTAAWGVSWTVITISDVWDSFFTDCEEAASSSSPGGAAAGGAAASSSSGSRQGNSKRRRSKLVGVKDDKKFGKLRHALATKYFFHITGISFLHNIARVFLDTYDLALEAKVRFRKVNIELNGIAIQKTDTSIKRFCRSITEIKQWGPFVGHDGSSFFGGLQQAPGAQITGRDLQNWLDADATPGKRGSNWSKKLAGKLLFSPPNFGEEQTIRVGEAFDPVKLEVYRIVKKPLPSKPLHFGVQFIKNGKSGDGEGGDRAGVAGPRVSFEPLSFLQRSYRRRPLNDFGVAPTAQQRFWHNTEWACELHVCVHGITGAACDDSDPNAVTVAEIMLIYMPSVEIKGEALEMLDVLGGFAAEQDMSQSNRWAESRLVTLWQSLVLPHETLDGKGRLPFMEDAPATRTRARGHGGRKAPLQPKKNRRLPGVTSPSDRVRGFIFLSNAFGIDIHKTRLKQPKSQFSGCRALFEESHTTQVLRQKYRTWLDRCAENDVIDVFSGYDESKHPEAPPHNLTMTSPSEQAFNRCVLATQLKRSGVEFNATKLVSVRSEVGGPIVGIFRIKAFYTAAEDGARSGQKPSGSRVLLSEDIPKAMTIGRVSDAWFYWPKSELLWKVKKPKEQKVWYEDRVAKCVELQEMVDGVPASASEATSSSSAASSSAAAGAVGPSQIATWSWKPKTVGVELEAKPDAMVFRIRNNSRSKKEKDYVMARRTKSTNAKTTWLPRLTLTISQDADASAILSEPYTDTVDANSDGEYTFLFQGGSSSRTRRGGEFRFSAAGEWHIHVGVADEDVSATATDGVRHRFFKALSRESGGNGVLKRTVVVTAKMQRWRLEPVVVPKKKKKKRESLKVRRGERCEFAALPVTEDGLAVPLDADCDVREFAARLIGDECTQTYDDLRVERVDSTERVVLSLRVRSDADLDENGVAIVIAMAQRARGNVSQSVYQWMHSVPTRSAPGNTVFVGIVGSQAAANWPSGHRVPQSGQSWHLRDLKENATSSNSAIECHSESDPGGLVFEILSGPPTRLELISPVVVVESGEKEEGGDDDNGDDGDGDDDGIKISRGPSTLRLEWKAYDAADGEYVPKTNKEAKLVFSGHSVSHLKVAQRTVKLPMNESTFVYECDACTEFNTSADLAVSLKIDNVEVANRSIALYAPSATLVFSKTVGRKPTLVDEYEEVYNEDEEASYVVMLCRNNKKGHLKPVKGEVRLDDANNPHPDERGVIIVSRNGQEVESIDFSIESNGKAAVQLPRNHVGVTQFEAHFEGAVVGVLDMTVVRAEAAAAMWVFVDRNETISLRSEAGAIAKDLRVQLRDTRGDIFTGDVDGYAPIMEFKPRGMKDRRAPFSVPLIKLSRSALSAAASSSSASASAASEGGGDDADDESVVWCAPHDAVIPPGKPGQEWTVMIVTQRKGLKTEKRMIEMIAGSAHHLDVRVVEGTSNGLKRLERDVGVLRLEVAVVDTDGRAVDQSQLGRWHITLEAAPAAASDGTTYDVLPAVGETSSDKRLAKLLKKERDSSRQILCDGGHDGSWTLPPLLIGVDSRAQGTSKVKILIRTCKEKTVKGRKKKKRASRTSAMRANDEIVLEGSIELTLNASERVVDMESMVVSGPRVDAVASASASAGRSSASGRALQAVLDRRTVAQGLPSIKFSVASDDGEPVAIDLEKVTWEVTPLFDGNDELYRVEVGDGDVFSLVPNHTCRRAGLHTVTASYLEDRYPLAVEEYQIEESVKVRLHVDKPALLKKYSTDRVVDVVSNVAERCTLFGASRSAAKDGVLRLQLQDAYGNPCTDVPSSTRVRLILIKEGGGDPTAPPPVLHADDNDDVTLTEGSAEWWYNDVRLKLGSGDSDAAEGKYALVAEVPDLRDALGQRITCEVGTFDFRRDKDTTEIDKLQLSKLQEHLAEHEERAAKTREKGDAVEALQRELEQARSEEADWEREHPRAELESQVGALELRLFGRGEPQPKRARR